MQFIENGPDIPEALLQAQEEGRVVFFCGAGISYPAGLPGFRGLVEQIYRLNGTALSDIERGAFEREQFDATLDLLERRLPGQPTYGRPPHTGAGLEAEAPPQGCYRYTLGAVVPGSQPRGCTTAGHHQLRPHFSRGGQTHGPNVPGPRGPDAADSKE